MRNHRRVPGTLRAARLEETGLLPHLNPGVMSRDDLARLRGVSVSMGPCSRTSSERLGHAGGAHFGSPRQGAGATPRDDRRCGELAIPFTTGILIGIGETRLERLEALKRSRPCRTVRPRPGSDRRNFRAKPGTKMAAIPSRTLDDLLWTAAAARLVPPRSCARPVPPNLSYDRFGRYSTPASTTGEALPRHGATSTPRRPGRRSSGFER